MNRKAELEIDIVINRFDTQIKQLEDELARKRKMREAWARLKRRHEQQTAVAA
jgi:hypothetical protein